MKHLKSLAIKTLKQARRVVVLVVGCTVLIMGIIMLVTPGPAFIVIPTGLAILATEYVWARVWLQRLRNRISNTAREMTRRRL